MAGHETQAVMRFFGVEWQLYLICAVGSLVLFFCLQKKKTSIFDIVSYVSPEYGDSPVGRICEAVLFIGIGAIIGTIMAQPGTPQQALYAGFGWTGILTHIEKPGKKQNGNPRQ